MLTLTIRCNVRKVELANYFAEDNLAQVFKYGASWG